MLKSRQKWRCVSCYGTYITEQHDGTTYYHMCPRGTNKPRDENLIFIEELNPQTGEISVVKTLKSGGQGRLKAGLI